LAGRPQSTLEELETAEVMSRLREVRERLPQRQNVLLDYVGQGERV